MRHVREVTILHGAVSPPHVHVLVSVPSQLAPSKLVQHIKGRSSRRLQEISKIRFWRITKDLHLSTFIV